MPDEILLPQISVALVTRNRPESIERALKSLREQSVQPHQVVISDDSNEAIAPQIERLAQQYHALYVRGPQRGLYANRNHAALACAGTHIRTMDDDHEFPEDHFAKCMAAIASDPAAVWNIGEFPDFEAVNECIPQPGQLQPRGFSEPARESENCWAIADGSSIYPKVLFDQGIRYVEFFKFGSAFLELGSRLRWLGYRIRFIETTYIIHHTMEFQQGGTVWFQNARTANTSRLFAMFCHSFIYQATLRNRLLTSLQVTGECVALPAKTLPSLLSAVVAYREHRKNLRAFMRNRSALPERMDLTGSATARTNENFNIK